MIRNILAYRRFATKVQPCKAAFAGLAAALSALLPLTVLAQADSHPMPSQINGQPVVILKRAATLHDAKPEFISATILPGRGMNLLQITAKIPGKGVINILATPSLDQVAQALTDDPFGNMSFSTFGGAFLVPYANRIRGSLSPNGQTLTTSWRGKQLTLPANWSGKNPGAERHSIHGLILKRNVDDLQVSPDGATVAGIIHAGNFDGHWLSSTDLTISIELRADTVESTITARNVGVDPEPMGIGWHPYFTIPSGQRQQVRLHIPATEHVETNNLDDVFPTGKLTSVKGTSYDFTAPRGRAIGDTYYDDCFAGLVRTNGQVAVDIIDPAARYGLHIQGLSPDIKTVQFYAPKDKPFVALEEQYNFGDPFSIVWKGTDTGMVTLAPGQSTTWRVRLQLFTPPL